MSDNREKVKDILVKYTEPVLKYDGITLHEVSGMIEKIYQEASDYEWEGILRIGYDGEYGTFEGINLEGIWDNNQDDMYEPIREIKELEGKKVRVVIREIK